MLLENKTLVRRYVEEVLNKRNLALIDELFAPTFIDHDTSMPEAKGAAGVKRLAAMVHDSFSDLHFTVEDMVAEGDKVVYRYSVRGTHKGSFMGIAPTGEQFAVTGIHIYRVADGKLQEEWENWDMLGLMRQLGVIPQPAAIA
ncbi:MAG TPA: ester cyclase [Candidatus Binataceae bacterium]|jgi:steroid delta-isomerase-like uncharacterized protein|nr:ester cyclase [Candidatus Binataceae bacterium]